ncbi:MAG: TauD/TfdA family dioxygenase [Burkholderiaceae bacterium]
MTARTAAILGQPVVDPAAWTGDDLARDRSWCHTLSAAEITDLQAMAKGLRQAIGDEPNRLLAMSRQDFALGAFEPRLVQVRHQLSDGLGVALIRGLPVDDMDPLDTAAIYWAIGRHLGQARSNNPEGDMLGHVTDLGKRQDDPTSRGYQTRETMDYHCDQCSIVGLLCIRDAQSGVCPRSPARSASTTSCCGANPMRAAAEPTVMLDQARRGRPEPATVLSQPGVCRARRQAVHVVWPQTYRERAQTARRPGIDQ